MIRLIANEAKPSLGLSGSICRPKTRLRVMKTFVFFFGLKVRLPGSQQVKIHRDRSFTH